MTTLISTKREKLAKFHESLLKTVLVVLSLFSCSGCPVKTATVFRSTLSCQAVLSFHDLTVIVVYILSWLSATVVLSLLSLTVVLSVQYCPLHLSCPASPALTLFSPAPLSPLSCAGCHFLTFLSLLSYPGCPLLTVLLLLSCPGGTRLFLPGLPAKIDAENL
jgi:hypothetical protein